MPNTYNSGQFQLSANAPAHKTLSGGNGIAMGKDGIIECLSNVEKLTVHRQFLPVEIIR
jgi:hypothetical protein